MIELQHDVMNPQPYNRLYQLTGTRGFANKYPIEGYALDSKQLSASGVQPKVDNLSTHSFMPEAERKALEEKYDHPILKKFGKLAKEVGGHGGMDFVMTRAWSIVCRTDCRSTWTCTTWRSGAR